jgi:hypothetical protein
MKTGRPKELDVVKLTRDLPEFGIRAGHVGTIVFVHPAEAVMVEFMDRKGKTVALLHLADHELRPATKDDLERRDYPESLAPGLEAPIADAVVRPG